MQTLTRDEYFSNPNSVVSVIVRSPQTYFPEHVHEFDELVIVRSGSGMNFINGKPMSICRGSVFYVRANQSHRIDWLEDLYLTNVLILPTRFKHVSQETIANLLTKTTGVDGSSYMIPSSTMKRVEHVLNRILEESDQRVEYADPLIELLIGQLLIELWRGQPDENKTTREETDVRLTKLLRHLNAHFEEDIDWDLLANRFKLPMRTLSRKITDVTGMPPSKYLLRIRLCRAMHMLRATDRSITDIALSCGFNDGNYFSQRFHREIGTTPLKYRHGADS